MANLDALYGPKAVAIVGDSPGGGRGGVMHENLLRFGFRGTIIPVNPRYDEIRGLRCHPSLAEVDQPYDCVALAVGARTSVQALGEAARAGARAAVMVAGGFAEAGPDGEALQRELAAIARDAGMAVCGPNCYGVLDLHSGFAAYSGWLPAALRPGPVALLTQSGALTHALLNPASERGLGLSHLVTAGNEAVTTLSDHLAYVAGSPDVAVIGCFIESLRDVPGFVAAARRAAAAGKRIVALKTGRSRRAQDAARAHTGALTGDDRQFDALCDRLGIVRVGDLDELIECCLLLSAGRPPAGSPAVMSISGGASGLIADLAEEAGLPLAGFGETARERLRATLPPFGSVNNPLDLTGAAAEDPAIAERAAAILAAAPEVGTVAVSVNATTADTERERELYAGLLRATARAAHDARTPCLAFTMTSGPFAPELLGAAREAGIPLLQGIRETLRCLAGLRRADLRAAPPAPEPAAPPGLAAFAAELAAGTLAEGAARALPELAGIAGPRGRLVTSPDEAASAARELGGPVVMKVDSPGIPHKTDAGCVRLGVPAADAGAAYADLVAAARAAAPDARLNGVLVQETAPDGLDVLLGAVVSEPAAPVVILGTGGVLAELAGPPAARIAPVNQREATDMLAEFPGAPLLDGYRGSPPADRAALAAAIVRFSQLVWLLRDRLAEADVNPLRVLPAGRGVLALDALALSQKRS